MKRLASLFLVALVAVVLPVITTGHVDAQDQVYVTPAAENAASDIVNARVVSTTSVEVNGEMHRATEIEISSAAKGDLTGSVLVETPGGERPDGTVVFVSHTPELVPGELVQLALTPTQTDASFVLPTATGRDLVVYSVVAGTDGAWGLLPDGVGRADAVGDFTLTGASWPDFAPPVPFSVNYRNSGTTRAGTIAAVRRAFTTWEDDPGSTIDFTYKGETTKVGLNLNDDVNTISWIIPPPGTTWLAQASWIASGSGDIIGFDVRVNRNYSWANGVASGRYDIATVVAHEVGHGLGFGHAPVPAELMFFQVPQATTKGLGAGDRSGAAFLYPYQGPRCDGLVPTVEIGLGQAPTSGPDVILGTNGVDTINALGGDDVICGLGGADYIVGGGGNDIIRAGDGDDEVFGGEGDDTIFGGDGKDRVRGQNGDDIIRGNNGNDNLNGNNGDDQVFGDAGHDYVSGRYGEDRLEGGSGSDTLNGGGRSDILLGGSGNDIINGNGYSDQIFGGNGNDTLSGGDGDDIVNGGAGNDSINGNRDDDTLIGAGGTDTCDGMTGVDTASGCESQLNIP